MNEVKTITFQNERFTPVFCTEWAKSQSDLEAYKTSLITMLASVSSVTGGGNYNLLPAKPAQMDQHIKENLDKQYIYLDSSETVETREILEESDSHITLVLINRQALFINKVKRKKSQATYSKVIISEIIQGREYFAHPGKIKFETSYIRLSYNKRRGSLVTYSKNFEGYTGLTYSSFRIFEQTRNFSDDANVLFFNKVIEHISEKTSTQYSYLADPKDLDPEFISYVRRLKRNVHNHHKNVVANIPLCYVGFPLSKIVSKVGLPKFPEIMRAFTEGTDIPYYLSLTKIAKSFKVKGVSDVSSKMSPDNLQKILLKINTLIQEKTLDYEESSFNIFEEDDRVPAILDNKTQYQLSRDSVFYTVRNMFRGVFDEYILYLSQKDILFGSNYGYYYNPFEYISQYAPDSQKMINSINAAGIGAAIGGAKSLKDFHNQLTKITNELKKADLPVPNPSQYSSTILIGDDEYVFMKPQSTHKIVEVGKIMDHCVASYTNEVLNGSCEIITLNHEDKPLVCIEVRGKKILQAKMSHNRPVKLDKKLNKLVKQWAEKFQLPTTKDVSVG